MIREEPKTVWEVMARIVASARPDHRRGFFNPASGTVAWVTYETLLRQSWGLGARMRNLGIRAGDFCVLMGMPPRTIVTSFFAAVSVGAVPLILAPPKALAAQGGRLASTLEHWLSRLGRRSWLVTDQETRSALAELASHTLTRTLDAPTPAELEALAASGAPVGGAVGPDDVLHLQATSASTGPAKATRITHRNVLVNVQAIRRASDAGPAERVCTWLPLYHDMGLVGTELFSLCHGYSLVSMTPFDFIRRPGRWLRLISEQRCTLSPAPNFGYEYAADNVRDDELAALDLSCWKVAYNGAEPLRRQSLQRFTNRFQPVGFDARAMRPCYGLAEGTLAVTMTSGLTAPRCVVIESQPVAIGRSVKLVRSATLMQVAEADERDGKAVVFSAGRPLPALEVRLVDEAGAPLAEDLVVGEVAVGGQSVAAGYLSESPPQRPFSPAFHTGDLGFFYGDELYIIDRLKNMVVHNGENYSSSVLEGQIAQRLGISPNRVAVLDGTGPGQQAGVIAVVEVESEGEVAVLSTAASASTAIDLPIRQLLLVKKRGIPRTSSGKKRHFHCRTMLVTHELVPLATINLQPTEGRDPAAA